MTSRMSDNIEIVKRHNFILSMLLQNEDYGQCHFRDIEFTKMYRKKQ